MNGRIKRSGPHEAGHSVPRIGKLKIGEKNAKGYPQSLDYFKPDGQYAGLFTEAFGAKPNKVQILFWTDDRATACNERWEGRTQDGKLWGRGDGEKYEVFSPNTDDYEQTEDRDRILVDAWGKPVKWSVRLTLRFLIPQVRVMGHWELSTGGDKSSVQALRDAFDMVLDKAGTVQRIPFDLSVKKVKSQKPGKKSVYPVLQLVPNLSEGNLLQIRQIAEGMDLNAIPVFTPELLQQGEKP